MCDTCCKEYFIQTNVHIIKEEKVSQLENFTKLLDCLEYPYKITIHIWKRFRT